MEELNEKSNIDGMESIQTFGNLNSMYHTLFNQYTYPYNYFLISIIAIKSTSSTCESSNELSIKEKLKRGIYSYWYLPTIMSIDARGIIEVNNQAPYPNEIEVFELKRQENHRNHKLKASSYGDWELIIYKVKMEHFDSREEFDDKCVDDHQQSERGNISQISIQKALLESFDLTLSCNMEYYLTKVNQLKRDLKHDIDIDECLKSSQTIQKLEEELFYNQMYAILGEEEDDDYSELINEEESLFEKSFVLKDYREFFFRDSWKFATCKRGAFDEQL
jgi:hypothetical protein